MATGCRRVGDVRFAENVGGNRYRSPTRHVRYLVPIDLATVVDDIRDEGVEVLTLTPGGFQAGADLLPTDAGLNVFDAVHVCQAITLGEPIVSTDTQYPNIDQIEQLDPRSL